VLVVIPLLVAYFLWVHRQYRGVADQLRMPLDAAAGFATPPETEFHNRVIVLVGSIDRRILPAIRYARSISGGTFDAVFVDATGDRSTEMRERWDELGFCVPLTVIESPFREIIEPIRRYIHEIPRPTGDSVITVLIPQFVPTDWADYGGVYVYRAGLRHFIKRALFSERNVIVADVPYYLDPDGPGSSEGTVNATDAGV
jgi:hypothetical protein